jgi:hypothetical protein
MSHFRAHALPAHIGLRKGEPSELAELAAIVLCEESARSRCPLRAGFVLPTAQMFFTSSLFGKRTLAALAYLSPAAR